MATELARKIRGTGNNLGKEVRGRFVEATYQECEPLTFGDIEKGDRFIVMPVPGDNHGHGGLLKGSCLFIKISEKNNPLSVSANAVNLSGGNLCLCHISEKELIYLIH